MVASGGAVKKSQQVRENLKNREKEIFAYRCFPLIVPPDSEAVNYRSCRMRNITPSNKKYLLPLKLVNSTHGAALPLVTFLPPDQSVNIKPYQMVSSADQVAIELLISKLEKKSSLFHRY